MHEDDKAEHQPHERKGALRNGYLVLVFHESAHAREVLAEATQTEHAHDLLFVVWSYGMAR